MQSKTSPWVVLLLVLAALAAPDARAQSRVPSLVPLHRAEALRAHSTREAARHDAEAVAAEQIRARLDVPETFTNAQGTYVLIRAENGLPVFVQTLGQIGVAATQPLPLPMQRAPGPTGQGVQVGLWDGGIVRRTHQELVGHATVVDKLAAAQTHATHLGGIIAGAGVDARAAGLAPDATILSYDWGRDRSEMATAAAGGLRVSNHSYGQTYGWVFNPRGDGRWAWLGDPRLDPARDVRFGQYDWLAAAWDAIAYEAPHYLIVKAAGNDRGEGPEPGAEHWIVDPVASKWVLTSDARLRDGGEHGFNTIIDAGNAKNVLTVGAVDANARVVSSSAFGPTSDGRIKPDLAAAGYQLYSASATSDQSYTVMTGTSAAAASATGTVAQLLEIENRLASQPLRASTYRALLLHTADAAGEAPGPDYAYGWGVINGHRAASVLEAGLRGKSNTLVREMEIAPGDETTVRVHSDGLQALRVTIAWTDPEGVADASEALVNDLDVEVTDGAGTRYAPWVLDPANPAAPAQRGLNTRDNVEQVLVEAPASGFYTVRVHFREQRGAPSSAVGRPQAFSIVATGLSEEDPSLPVELTAFDALADAGGVRLRWTTASETNNAGFGVEVQDERASAWREVAFVAGHGTTTEAHRYEQVVPDLGAGRYRFRLRQVDFDGAAEFSPEVEVEVSLDAAFAVAPPTPNPFGDRLETSFTVSRAQQVRADVYDMLGRIVATAFDDHVPAQSAQRVEVDGSELAPGVYVLVLTGETFRHAERIVRVR